MNKLHDQIKYLTTPFKNGLTQTSNKKKLKQANEKEKIYCCGLANIKPHTMWSATFGEKTFEYFLKSKNIKIDSGIEKLCFSMLLNQNLFGKIEKH